LLDTGGGIARALSLLGESPFIVMSADVWTDYPLQSLLQKKIDAAHLVLVNNPDFHPTGDFGLRHDGVVENDVSQKFTYANIAVLHPAIFQYEKIPIFPLSRVL